MMKSLPIAILSVVGLTVILMSPLGAQTDGTLQLPREPQPLPAAEPESPFLFNAPRRAEMAPVMNAPPRTTKPVASSRSVMATLDQTELDQDLRIKRIREKLDRLKKLAEACQPAPTSASADATEIAPPVPQSTGIPKVVQSPDLAPQQPVKSPSPPKPVTIPINLTATVDQLALANNLFAQGKTDAALSIYETLVQEPQTASDLVWIQYQLAACYRLTGRSKEARKLYRIVASAKNEDYWTGQAHWWLDYLQRNQALQERQQALQARLDSLRKETDELRKK